MQDPTLAGPPRTSLGVGTPSSTTPRQWLYRNKGKQMIDLNAERQTGRCKKNNTERKVNSGQINPYDGNADG